MSVDVNTIDFIDVDGEGSFGLGITRVSNLCYRCHEDGKTIVWWCGDANFEAIIKVHESRRFTNSDVMVRAWYEWFKHRTPTRLCSFAAYFDIPSLVNLLSGLGYTESDVKDRFSSWKPLSLFYACKSLWNITNTEDALTKTIPNDSQAQQGNTTTPKTSDDLPAIHYLKSTKNTVREENEVYWTWRTNVCELDYKLAKAVLG